jgi:hypothetical protein
MKSQKYSARFRSPYLSFSYLANGEGYELPFSLWQEKRNPKSATLLKASCGSLRFSYFMGSKETRSYLTQTAFALIHKILRYSLAFKRDIIRSSSII